MSIVKSAVDTYLAYRFVKLLVTPWENTEAYKLGVIDDDGKVLKSRRQRKTAEEKRSYNTFHRLVYNLKKIVQKIPFMRGKLGSLASALFLIKEYCHATLDDKLLIEKTFNKYINDHKLLTEREIVDFNKLLLENAPTNSVAAGEISGLTGNPPVSKKRQKRVIRRNKKLNWKKFATEVKRKRRKR